ncbi:hypothetical protein GQ44DRAFT_733033 [Phaeosphaeriaceae sp. PMI808]|nr:hypothetical protein GQ44DRAFT_733033 [Phaeosphaeriaceae sp. PMI808]
MAPYQRTQASQKEETPLCFFIDGLDECKPADIEHVIRVIGELALRSKSKIKFCVSSRPEQKLYNRLGGLAPQRLELHKLTERDIRRYVTDQFESSWKGDVSPTKEQQRELIDQLVSSSEGVFLWAFLVARKLCEAIEFGDSIDQLQEQLSELPHDMMKLYDSMLGKSDATKGHRRAEAATYFKFVIDHSERSIWHHIRHGGARCFYGGLENLVPFYEKYHERTQPKNLPSTLRIIRQRVNFLCAGIVVVEEPSTFSPELGFFHRTARDFFHKPSATEILQQCKLTELESYCLFVDAVSRHRHSSCEYELNAYETRQMIRWLQNMKESTDVDKLKFLQHINEAMSRVHAMKNGGFNENWVYDQAKLDLGDDRVLDFVTLTFQAGSTELLSLSLNMKRSLSGRYKDYLLLCSSDHGFAPAWRQKFLELGANPNATFYWGLQDRLKTSPWLQYLVSTSKCYQTVGSDEDDYDNLPNNDLDMDTINAFLDNGASLEDRTVLLKCLFSLKSSLDNVESRVLPPQSSEDLYDGMFFVIEVNAKYLLEEQCRPGRVRFSARRTKVLSRPDVQKSQSHRQVLLVHPGYSTDDLHPGTPSEDSEEESLGGSVPGELGLEVNNSGDARDNITVGSPGKLHPTPFAEIDFRDSERLLDELELVPHLGQRSLSEEVFTRKEEEALGIWQRCPKVQDFKQYLEDKGYYKKADDPAVPQGPISMFEDEE